MEKVTDNQSELKIIQQQLESLLENQREIKKEIRMIFADISHFESLVLKILDSTQRHSSKEKYQH